MHSSSALVVLLFWNAFLGVDLLAIDGNAAAEIGNAADGDNDLCLREPHVQRATVLDAVKQEILLRLGLLEEPQNPENASEVFSDPQFLQEYELVKASQDLNEKHTPCANTDFLQRETLKFFAKEVQRKRPLHRIAEEDDCANDLSVDYYNSYTIKFDIDLSSSEYVTDAQLRLVKLPFEHGNVEVSRIDLFMISRPDNYFDTVLPLYITSQLHYSSSMDGLVIFNVSSAIMKWLDTHPTATEGEIEFQIRIRCAKSMDDNFIPNVQLFGRTSQGHLVMTTYKDISYNGSEPTTARFRRDINDDLNFCGATEVQCCLTRFRIDFVRDFGWTWVFPRDIAFNYCGGLCPRRWQLSTLHAAFLDIFRTQARQNPTAAPEPCCVPNSYESLTLSIYLNGKKTFDYFQDLVATSCACR